MATQNRRPCSTPPCPPTHLTIVTPYYANSASGTRVAMSTLQMTMKPHIARWALHHNKNVSYTRDPMNQSNTLHISSNHTSRNKQCKAAETKEWTKSTISTEPPPACIHPTHSDRRADTRLQRQLLHWSHDGERTA